MEVVRPAQTLPAGGVRRIISLNHTDVGVVEHRHLRVGVSENFDSVVRLGLEQGPIDVPCWRVLQFHHRLHQETIFSPIDTTLYNKGLRHTPSEADRSGY